MIRRLVNSGIYESTNLRIYELKDGRLTWGEEGSKLDAKSRRVIASAGLIFICSQTY
jgi:hypothetical protein